MTSNSNSEQNGEAAAPKDLGNSSSQNYYDLLGISAQATDEEIKRAYRQKALRLHPDKNPDPEAASQFQAVDKAYKILSDPKLRSAYDQFGPRTADTMRKMNDEYSEAMAQMPRWKKVLFTILCLGTCCCFGGGCCCLCGCICCCNFCCNHCCGKYKPEQDPFSSFQQEEEEIPGLRTQNRVNNSGPRETDPVLGQNSKENSSPIAANYEATSEKENQ